MAVSAAIVMTATGGAAAGMVDVQALHWAQWDSALAQQQADPAVQYAFYAYRSLAVPNPEAYLRADSIFLDIIAGIPGSRAAYRGRDVRDFAFFRRFKQRQARGPSFSITAWAPELDSITDQGVTPDGVSWLDRRLPSAAVLLHGPVHRLSTAEAAMLRYSQYRRLGAQADSVYVVIDTSGSGYFVVGARVFSPQSLQALNEVANITPALIFNEHVVYYPLMERDDRATAPRLAAVADRFATAASPTLSETEQQIVAQAKSAAALTDDVSRRMAALFASGAVDVTDSAVAAAWGTPAADSLNEIGLLVRGMMGRVMHWADRLSATSAGFAALAVDQPFAAAATALTDSYLRACGRRVDPKDSTSTELEAGGNIWSYGLLEVPIDDIVRLRTGQPSSQALAMSAILDAANLRNYRVHLDYGQQLKPDQHWVITDDGHWQFNLGTWTEIPDTVPAGMRYAVKLRACASGNLWLGLGDSHPVGDNDALGAAALLSRLEAIQPGLLIRAPAGGGTWGDLGSYVYRLTDGSMAIQPFPWDRRRQGR